MATTDMAPPSLACWHDLTPPAPQLACMHAHAHMTSHHQPPPHPHPPLLQEYTGERGDRKAMAAFRQAQQAGKQKAEKDKARWEWQSWLVGARSVACCMCNLQLQYCSRWTGVLSDLGWS